MWVLTADKFKVSQLSGCIQVTGKYFNYHLVLYVCSNLLYITPKVGT